MKRYYILISVLILFLSCTKETTPLLDFTINEADISKIELRADHKTLVPNGISKMQFYPIVYAKKNVVAYARDNAGAFETQNTESEFIVPADLIPPGMVRIYDGDGKELPDHTFATNSMPAGTELNFYAKGGNVQSEALTVTIRPLPDESYDSIIVPVIFHLLLPPPTAAPSYEVSSAFLQEQLDQVSRIMNREVTSDPNAGNAKIRFQLALFDPNGLRLAEPGKNIQNISAADLTAMGTSSDLVNGYKAYILRLKKQLIWDPNKYLNIWLGKYTNSTATLGGKSYQYATPSVMHSSFPLTSIPGLKGIKTQDHFTVDDVTDCLQAGIIMNLKTLFNPNTQGANEFSLATPIAGHFGVLETWNDRYRDLNADGDNDYCPDTYNYDYYANLTVFKHNKLYQQPANDPNRPLEYFTSFNIMDYYSRKNSISVDQVNRMRKVLEQCPSRWSYKSNWAFTGN